MKLSTVKFPKIHLGLFLSDGGIAEGRYSVGEMTGEKSNHKHIRARTLPELLFIILAGSHFLYIWQALRCKHNVNSIFMLEAKP